MLAGVGVCSAQNSPKVAPKPAAVAPIGPQATVKPGVVAQINGVDITVDEFNKELAVYNKLFMQAPPEQRSQMQQLTTKEQRIDFLKESVVPQRLFLQEALKRGIDKNPEVVDMAERARIQMLIMALLREETKSLAVNDKEIEDYYNANKQNFKKPGDKEPVALATIKENVRSFLLMQKQQQAVEAMKSKLSAGANVMVFGENVQ